VEAGLFPQDWTASWGAGEGYQRGSEGGQGLRIGYWYNGRHYAPPPELTAPEQRTTSLSMDGAVPSAVGRSVLWLWLRAARLGLARADAASKRD
jgi:hypothetical protein